MASEAPFRLITERDLEILTALDHSPLTAIQILKLSKTFTLPFTHERRVRARLHLLCEAGRVRRWPYATAGRGVPNYYTLTLIGYRILHGEDAQPPMKRMFGPVGLAKQRHTQSLAEFIIHTLVCAHQNGLTVSNVARENSLRLVIDDDTLFPDCSFQLNDASGQIYHFFVEIDGGSERIRSPKDIDSWERKIRLYDQLQDRMDHRFRVLIVSIESTIRVGHILSTAATLMRNPQRSLFYGTSLPEYLLHSNPLRQACFQTHRGDQVPLIPQKSLRISVPDENRLEPAAA
jgi:Replication-relaxation